MPKRQSQLDSKNSLSKKQRSKLLLSNLLKCGCCGGGFTKISKLHYGCFSARKKAICNNLKTIRQDELEKSILESLQNHLMKPDLCEVFCKEYTRHMNELRMQHNGALAGYKAELGKLEKRRHKIIESIAGGVPGAMLKDESIRLMARMEELKVLLEEKKEVQTLLHPSMAQRYHAEVKALVESLNDAEHRHEAADLIRKLVEKIVLTPKEGEDDLSVDLHGDLAGILSIATGKSLSKQEKSVLTQDVSNVQDLLVAGTGFEPVTFRL